MTRPTPLDQDALWNFVVDRRLHLIHLQELYWLAQDVVVATEEVFENTSDASKGPPVIPLDEGYLRIDRGLGRKIHSALSAAVRIKNLVEVRSRRHGKQSDAGFALGQRRAEWLRQEVLAGLELDEVLKNDVRNTLEHFDEYADETAVMCFTGEIHTPVGIVTELFISDRAAWQQLEPAKSMGGHVYEFRGYVEAERTFTNCGEQVNLQRLHDESVSIRERVLSINPQFGEGGDRSTYSIILFPTHSGVIGLVNKAPG